MSPTRLAAPERLLHRIDWKVIRRLDGLLQGDYRSLLFGDGIDFADLREYQPHDDIRRIEWNVTARMDTPHVREHVEDRELTAWFLIDRSPSMSFGTTGRRKDETLVELTTTLARLLTRNGNRVGAIVVDDVVAATIAPRGGRDQVLHLTRTLQEPKTREESKTGKVESGVSGPNRRRRLFGRKSAPAAPRSDLTTLMHAASGACRRRALIFVLSDFIGDPGWERPLALLAQRHEVITVRISDPAEHALPDAGSMVVEDAETGEQLRVDTSDPDLRARFVDAVDARESDLTDAMNRSGVDLFTISTDDDLAESLLRMADHRRRRARVR